MDTSIIIRVKNEKENLEKLFTILKNQTYQDFEIILVDNMSTDGSEKVIFDYFPKNRIYVVKLSKFSYPKACNLGAEKAKGKYLVYLSAHSFPFSNTWLADGLSNFKNENIAGVFAYPLAGSNGTLWEKISCLMPIIGFKLKLNNKLNLGNTNSIIRHNLWEKHRFDEELLMCEDFEWSIYWKSKGYEIIYEPKFVVYHSHHLGLWKIIKRQIEWKNTNKAINFKFKH